MNERDAEPGPAMIEESESLWSRALFMLLFVAIYGVAEIVVLAVTLIQFGWVAATGEKNERLLRFGKDLSTFVRDVIRYWTFSSEDKPFPFREWTRATARQEAS